MGKDRTDVGEDEFLKQQQCESQDASTAYCKVQLDTYTFIVPARIFCMCVLVLQAVLLADWCCTRVVCSCCSFGQFYVFSVRTTLHGQMYWQQHASARCAGKIPVCLQLSQPYVKVQSIAAYCARIH